uniref:Uncharacterized protein n=1 Tax=Glossina brevipalpis TaxID=37001 RepID=A0A1A9W8U6_9MUSC
MIELQVTASLVDSEQQSFSHLDPVDYLIRLLGNFVNVSCNLLFVVATLAYGYRAASLSYHVVFGYLHSSPYPDYLQYLHRPFYSPAEETFDGRPINSTGHSLAKFKLYLNFKSINEGFLKLVDGNGNKNLD